VKNDPALNRTTERPKSLLATRLIWFSAGASVYGFINLLLTRSPEQAETNFKAWWSLIYG
jgi:hypothetical protein